MRQKNSHRVLASGEDSLYVVILQTSRNIPVRIKVNIQYCLLFQETLDPQERSMAVSIQGKELLETIGFHYVCRLRYSACWFFGKII